MRTATFLTALLLASTASAAATPQTHADVALDFFIPLKTTAAPSLDLYGAVRNYGPDAATSVTLKTSLGRIEANCTTGSSGECVFASLPAGAEERVVIHLQSEVAEGSIGIQVSVTSATHDPDPRNNRVTRSIALTLAPQMRFFLIGAVADPGETVEYSAYIANDSQIAASDVAFTLPLPEGWRFERSLSDALQCTTEGQNLRCSIAVVEARTSVQPRFLLRAPESADGQAPVYTPIHLTTAHGVINESYNTTGYFIASAYRQLVVTTSADQGDGSLRNAIDRANTECVVNAAPCKIVFDIASASPGTHQTIQPLTPLPPINAISLVIDGSTQTARRGDTNPAGPEIEINGSLLAAGDGFDMRGSLFTIRELAINGFPGNGISVAGGGSSRVIERCYIGTDVTGRTAVPNGLRGISASIDGQYYSVNLLVRDNVISGNTRSGVYVFRGTGVGITGNRIGVSADDPPLPLGNGATGVFFGPQAGGSVQKNLIAFNAGAGVGSAPTATWIAIRGNSIFSNGALGIDHGLDLVTPNLTRGFRDVPNFPVLTAARYDEKSGTTHIEGRLEEPYLPSVADVELFANSEPGLDGHGEGELFLGRVSATALTFSFDYAGDLRGRFITATFTKPNNYYPELPDLRTSEFSEAIAVEGNAAAPIDRSHLAPRGSDLWLLFYPAIRIPAGTTYHGYANVVDLGPERAHDVIVELSVDRGRLRNPLGGPCREVASGLRCITANAQSISFDLETPANGDRVTIRGRVTAANEDTDPTNNAAAADIALTVVPGFDLQITSPRPVDPDSLATYTVRITHRTVVDARDVTVTIPKPQDWSFVEQPSASSWTCSAEPLQIVCRTPRIAGGDSQSFSYTLRAPSRAGLEYAETARVSTAIGVLYDAFGSAAYEVLNVIRVTTTADVGIGSLRDAIARANDVCRPQGLACKIAFALEPNEAANGVFTIRPRSPLPRITASRVVLDGRTQTSYGGDTNPFGPEVELSGADVPSGNGLEMTSDGEASIRGLIINAFPLNGIEVRREDGPAIYTLRRTIADNYIGTDATGTQPRPNGLRGIAVSTAKDFPAVVHIVSNVISGNTRSGIFITSGSTFRITGNRIGVSAGAPGAPLGNGASGIFLGEAMTAQIEANEIAYNDIGIAIANSASNNGIRANSIHDNVQLGIDHGIDRVTFNDAANRREDLPPFPVILSAQPAEGAQVTRIEILVQPAPYLSSLVEIFRNTVPDDSGYGEAEEPIGEVIVPPGTESYRIEMTIPRDLRGSFVTATLSRVDDSYGRYWTSEISQAVPVQ